MYVRVRSAMSATITRGDGSRRRTHGHATPLILTTRIIKHITKEKTSEMTYIQYLICCFANCKSKVITSDPHPSAGEFDGVVIRAYTIS